MGALSAIVQWERPSVIRDYGRDYGRDYWTVMVPIIWGWMEQVYL
jgi:hypothetical protein